MSRWRADDITIAPPTLPHSQNWALPTNCRRRCRWAQQRAGLGSFPVAPASRRRFARVVAGNRRRDAGATTKVDVPGESVGKAAERLTGEEPEVTSSAS